MNSLNWEIIKKGNQTEDKALLDSNLASTEFFFNKKIILLNFKAYIENYLVVSAGV